MSAEMYCITTCSQPVLLSGVEVLVVESEESVCHTGLQREGLNPNLTSQKQVREMFDSVEKKAILIA